MTPPDPAPPGPHELQFMLQLIELHLRQKQAIPNDVNEALHDTVAMTLRAIRMRGEAATGATELRVRAGIDRANEDLAQVQGRLGITRELLDTATAELERKREQLAATHLTPGDSPGAKCGSGTPAPQPKSRRPRRASRESTVFTHTMGQAQ